MGEEYVVTPAIEKLKQLLVEFPEKAARVSAYSWQYKRDAYSWSAKEVLGHLVDSALANLQRFVRAQFQSAPQIRYDQNNWVLSQYWQDRPVEDILELWIVVNKQLAHVWGQLPRASYTKEVNVGSTEVVLMQLSELIEDYIQHMESHLEQINMPKVTVIAAKGKANELGKGNDLIWHLPEDLKRFKRVTSGHSIIMGRKTFESIGKPLPNRTSVIITTDNSYKKEGCIVVHSMEEALAAVHKESEVFIIGGAQVYRQALTMEAVTQLDITEVHEEFEADVFFPEIDAEVWEEVSREDYSADEKNKYNYSFVSYLRKK